MDDERPSPWKRDDVGNWYIPCSEEALHKLYLESSLWFNIVTREIHDMGSLDKVIASRQKTVDMLTARIAEYETKIATLGVGSSPRVALVGLVKLDKERLARVQKELEGLKGLADDPRQVPLPGHGKGR